MSPSDESIRDLLIALGRRPAFIVTGSGAEAGLAPGYSQLRSGIEQQSYDAGIIVPGLRPGMELDRLYGSSGSFWTGSRFVTHLGPDTLRGLLWHGLSIPVVPVIGNQYRLFDLTAAPSLVFNLNLTFIAERTCKDHTVISPHGTVSSLHPLLPALKRILDGSLKYGFNAHGLRSFGAGLTLSVPESPSITASRPEYALARDVYPKTGAMIIIGYSFGRLGSSIDDNETLAYLVDLLKRDPKPVIIVDIQPEHTAGLLDRENVHVPISLVTASWRPLALAMRRLAISRNSYRLEWLADEPAIVRDTYLRARDIEEELQEATHGLDRRWLTLRLDRADDFRTPITLAEYLYLVTETEE